MTECCIKGFGLALCGHGCDDLIRWEKRIVTLSQENPEKEGR